MFLLIHCLGHLLLLPARRESIHHKGPNEEYDPEYGQAHFFADARRWWRVRVDLQTGGRFHRLFQGTHWFTTPLSPPHADWGWGGCGFRVPPGSPNLRHKP